MRTNAKKLLPLLFVIAFLVVVFPVWSQDSQPEQTPEEQTTTAETEQSDVPEMSSEEPLADIDSEISVWTNDVEEDSSKAEEYGEIPEGFFVNFLKADIQMKDDRFLGVRARNVGLNNGIYGFDYGVTGKYQVLVDYRKIPHLFSKSGETIYNENTSGVWELADSVQGAIQGLNPFPVNSSDPNYANALNAQRAFISSLLTEAHPTHLGLQRNRGTVGLAFSPGLNWNYGVEYFRENRDGFRPYGATLGFSWLQELPEQIDYNTDRVRAGVEYANNGTTFAAAYEFSGFNNEFPVMIWDNPLRLTDRAEQSAGDGTSRGRLQLPTDNNSNMISLSGSTRVGGGKITGAFAYNTWKSDPDLLPYTINSALPQIALPSSTFNGELRNITADVRYYSRVGSKGTFTASYRFYDQSNENDELLFTAFSPLDASVSEDEKLNPLFAFTTNNIDLDYQHSLSDSFRWLVGYSYNRWDREERDTDQTNTNVFRTGVDYLASDRITVHARYQYDRRRSDEFTLHLPVYDVIPLRRYDVADLNRNVFRVTADFAIGERSTLGLTAGLQNNDYTNTQYGLQEGNYYTIGANYSYAFTNLSTFNVWYEHSRNTRDQLGRQSSSSTPSTSTDFDWSGALEDIYDTVGLGFLMPLKEGKCNWNTDFVYARANGKEDLSGGVAIRPTGAVSLNNVDDTEHFSFRTSVAIKTFPRARFVIGYWLDTYSIDDFSENAIQTDQIRVVDPITGVVSAPGVILLNARQPDYTYHNGWLGFTYSW
ncbi:MAG TPA: MtrB/PioB family decaheme-associated outer membrane protein [Acidobacteriota bacterium]|nr:MtrB/PioB family decaheme-associated outer membrane protein [Acidobacteriota bacterium]